MPTFRKHSAPSTFTIRSYLATLDKQEVVYSTALSALSKAGLFSLNSQGDLSNYKTCAWPAGGTASTHCTRVPHPAYQSLAIARPEIVTPNGLAQFSIHIRMELGHPSISIFFSIYYIKKHINVFTFFTHRRRSGTQKPIDFVTKINNTWVRWFLGEASRLKQATPFWRLLAMTLCNKLSLNSPEIT